MELRHIFYIKEAALNVKNSIVVYAKNMDILFKTLFAAFLFLLACLSTVSAETRMVEVKVLDRHGKPIPQVLVLSEKLDQSNQATASYVIEQANMAFSPEVLVIPVGSTVSFPNVDTFAHHVYSFSKPNQFTLSLYHQGQTPSPVKFEHSGIVVLGCNIHDHMIGHIVVTENQDHVWTDANGIARIKVSTDNAEQSVRIWHSRINTRREQMVKSISPDSTHLVFNLSKRLRPARETNPRSSY